MATVNPIVTHHAGADGDETIFRAVWTLTSTNVDGAPVNIPEWADKTWHMTGTLGSAVCAVQGAALNVEADFAALSNAADGAALTMAAVPSCKLQLENPAFARPKLTTAGSGASLVVTLTAVRPAMRR